VAGKRCSITMQPRRGSPTPAPAAKAFVASPNFSENAQRHNVEAGWLVRSPRRVGQVHQHIQRLVAEGLFVQLV
jgi:hypothetical protein